MITRKDLKVKLPQKYIAPSVVLLTISFVQDHLLLLRGVRQSAQRGSVQSDCDGGARISLRRIFRKC